MWMCILFLGHCIKWPCAVRAFYGEIRRKAGESSTRMLTASALVQAFRYVLTWCSGHDWKEMFEQMNQGRQDAISGLAVHGQQLGLLRQPGSPGTPGKRRRGKEPPEPEGITELLLGRKTPLGTQIIRSRIKI